MSEYKHLSIKVQARILQFYKSKNIELPKKGKANGITLISLYKDPYLQPYIDFIMADFKKNNTSEIFKELNTNDKEQLNGLIDISVHKYTNDLILISNTILNKGTPNDFSNDLSSEPDYSEEDDSQESLFMDAVLEKINLLQKETYELKNKVKWHTYFNSFLFITIASSYYLHNFSTNLI